jgi:hypothetical protein
MDGPSNADLERPFPATPPSPYLKPGRLAAIIAAIQAMSTAPWGGGTVQRWVRDLDPSEGIRRRGEEVSRDKISQWTEVFEDHPEFFTVYFAAGEERRIGLRWRYAAPITYDTTLNREATAEELANLPKDDAFYERYTRKPLTADQVGVLLNTAIQLHTRAISEKEARHWYIPLVTAALGAAVAFLVAWLKR